MPWHDVAFKVVGKMVADVSNHFIEYWNFTLLEKSLSPIVSNQHRVNL
jgi:phosphatidylserine/phosphatidylglycerophosphate/cardiolipin synthase-like enzyme